MIQISDEDIKKYRAGYNDKRKKQKCSECGQNKRPKYWDYIMFPQPFCSWSCWATYNGWDRKEE